MQELAGLDEIKINKPTSNLDILNRMLEPDEYDDYILSAIVTQDSLEDWMDYEGLDENEPDDAEKIQLGKIYFAWKSRNDIYTFTVSDEEDAGDIVFPKPYKSAITYGLGDSLVQIIMHNF